jgi:hypothetical protein
MQLMIYYTILSFIGSAIAATLCVTVEQRFPSLSLPLFFFLFAIVLWGAWRLAVWLTRGAEVQTTVDKSGSPARPG